MSDESTDNEAIYEQDCEFYRHQDGLMWGRFQTAAVIEGAILYLLYGGGPLNVIGMERRILLLAGAAIVFLVCLLSYKDRSDAARHLARIRQFETSRPLSHSRLAGTGFGIMLFAILLINLFNCWLLWNKW